MFLHMLQTWKIPAFQRVLSFQLMTVLQHTSRVIIDTAILRIALANSWKTKPGKQFLKRHEHQNAMLSNPQYLRTSSVSGIQRRMS